MTLTDDQRDDGLWRRFEVGAPASPGPCPGFDELAAYVDGRSVEPVEAHLADCAECRAAVAHARECLGALELPVAPPRVVAAARALRPRHEWRPGPVRRAAGWSLAAAASVAVCVAGYRVGLGVPGPAAGEDSVADLSFGLLELPAVDDTDLQHLLAPAAEVGP